MATTADDGDLFAEAMGKVQRLPEDNKITIEKRLLRAHEVARCHGSEAFYTAVETGQMVEQTEQPGLLLASGVSREKLKRLKCGQPPIARTIDLHGLNRDKALISLTEGVSSALANRQRVLAIIHGRGLHSSDGKPVLKEATYQWLSDGPFAGHVLAVVAQPGSGGGASLVLLRRH
ncbi:MAG: Smr/MutS family protein [Mariprofundus sp.]|nr:Smr/MutS family protein [Mariprofundus sp.]